VHRAQREVEGPGFHSLLCEVIPSKNSKIIEDQLLRSAIFRCWRFREACKAGQPII